MKPLLLLLALLGADPLRPTGDPAADRRTLQAACDAGGTVTLAAATWTLDRPIRLDGPPVTLLGDGRGRTVLRFPAGPGLVVGIPRAPAGAPPLASRLVDATGKLDATAGRRLGVRVGTGLGTLASGSSPFTFGRGHHWKGVAKLCLDWAFDTSDLPPGGGAVIGSATGGHAQPIAVTLNYFGHKGQRNLTAFVGAVRPDGSDADQQLCWPLAGDLAPGVHRVAVQVDLAAAKARCWLDGRALPDVPTPWKAADKLTTRDNRRVPWLAGALGERANQVWSDNWELARAQASTLLGAMLCDDLRYGWADQLTRLDGAPVADGPTYFQPQGQTVAWLRLDDDPAEVARDGTLAVGGADGATGVALVLAEGHASPYTASGGHRLADLSIAAATDAVLLGYALYCQVDRCDLAGAWGTGLGSWNWGANYTHMVRDSWLYGGDAAAYCWLGTWTLEGCHVENSGRCAFWSRFGRLRIEHAMIGPYGAPECYVRCDGGDVAARDLAIDVEDRSAPSEAVAVARLDGAPAASLGARLALDDLNLGDLAKGVPVVKLVSPAGAPKGALRLAGPATSGGGVAPMKALVQADDPKSWAISLDAPGLPGWRALVPPGP